MKTKRISTTVEKWCITFRTRNRSRTWVEGRIAGYQFCALVFPEHAERDTLELEGSKISKLMLRQRDGQIAFNWDRGSDVDPISEHAREAVGALCRNLADLVHGN